MTTSMWRQPKTVWAVAFACVIAFMGIGLVDPILNIIAEDLGAGPSQVSLLFTSYMAVMGVAMLITGWVSTRLGAKRTLIAGLAIIIVGSALAGMQDSIGGIVGWRAVWGLGNALFVATALSTIVAAARGSVGQAIILFEAALGLGIAAGPLVGGELGSITWRGPFYRRRRPDGDRPAGNRVRAPGHARHRPPDHVSPSRCAPFATSRLLVVALTALLYNFGFFTLLAFTPFPLRPRRRTRSGSSSSAGALLLAITSVFVAPLLQRRFGTLPGSLGVADRLRRHPRRHGHLAPTTSPCWSSGVVLAGAFLGVNNTLITETVMKAAPVERGVASAAYSFVRFSGGAVAPWLAGKLGEHVSIHAPFWVGAGAVLAGVLLLASGRGLYRHIDAEPAHGAESPHSRREAEVVAVADA